MKIKKLESAVNRASASYHKHRSLCDSVVLEILPFFDKDDFERDGRIDISSIGCEYFPSDGICLTSDFKRGSVYDIRYIYRCIKAGKLITVEILMNASI